MQRPWSLHFEMRGRRSLPPQTPPLSSPPAARWRSRAEGCGRGRSLVPSHRIERHAPSIRKLRAARRPHRYEAAPPGDAKRSSQACLARNNPTAPGQESERCRKTGLSDRESRFAFLDSADGGPGSHLHAPIRLGRGRGRPVCTFTAETCFRNGGGSSLPPVQEIPVLTSIQHHPRRDVQRLCAPA